jgi:DNA-binding CsgD family transcriptional regulator/PAS domain-containing protein
MARISPSLEAFSETVEAIYDCALNPQHWRDTLRLIGERTHSSNVAIGTMDYDQKRLVNAFEHGYDPAFWNAYLENSGVNPLLIRSRQRPLGQVYTLASLGDLEEVRKSRFHNEWIRAQRFGDLIGLNGLRFGRRVAGLVANRKDHQPPYGKHDLQVMRRLAPHVCRAFAVSDALDLKTINARMLEATLDALACGVYLTDRQCRVVYMNAAAERHIKTGKTLRIVSSRLSPVNDAARELLAHTLAQAIANEAEPSPCGISLALPDSDDAGLVATILPLDRGQRYSISGPLAAAAAVFVQDPTVAPPYPGAAFAKLYGLTGAELRVLLAMAPGLGLKDAGAMLGISEVTARTHLQHVFLKTGTSKQTELLNLLKNSTPPVTVA